MRSSVATSGFPLEPTVYDSNRYEPAWFPIDHLYTPDGVGDYPKHHCKKTFLTSVPYIERFDIGVDIGCRDGEYTRYMHHYFEHTFCFDPRFRPNFSANVDLKKVTHFTCALGDVEQAMTMYGGGHDPARQHAYETKCFRLDSFGLTDVSYIKIDVEGFERRVLDGAEATIRACRPVVVIEQNEVTVDGADQFEASDWLKARGYKLAATCPRGWDHIMVPG